MDELIENGKNKLEVKCKHCESIVLKPQTADYIDKPFDLPVPQSKTATSDTESLKDYWTVADMFTFENVGFSHTVDQVKFLVCADCELGPIGYHDIPTKKSFIAVDRVRHV